MHPLETFLIAVGLAMDAFAVAISSAASGCVKSRRLALRVAFFFGGFQFVMPLLGWCLSRELEKVIQASDHWVAFILLLVVGCRLVWSGLSDNPNLSKLDLAKGTALPALAVATSVDALIVGMSLGVMEVDILRPSIVTGIVTGVLSLFGAHLGNRIGNRAGRSFEVIGGLVLTAIGLRILFTHLNP